MHGETEAGKDQVTFPSPNSKSLAEPRLELYFLTPSPVHIPLDHIASLMSFTIKQVTKIHLVQEVVTQPGNRQSLAPEACLWSGKKTFRRQNTPEEILNAWMKEARPSLSSSPKTSLGGQICSRWFLSSPLSYLGRIWRTPRWTKPDLAMLSTGLRILSTSSMKSLRRKREVIHLGKKSRTFSGNVECYWVSFGACCQVRFGSAVRCLRGWREGKERMRTLRSIQHFH